MFQSDVCREAIDKSLTVVTGVCKVRQFCKKKKKTEKNPEIAIEET